jgi:hypothetical protein
MSRAALGALLLAAAQATFAAEARYDYQVQVGEGGRELAVQAQFSQVPRGCFEVGDRLETFVVGAEVKRGRKWREMKRANRCFDGADAHGKNVVIRYRFQLAEAAVPLGPRQRRPVWEDRGAYHVAPSAWLLRPTARTSGALRLRMDTPPGLWFVSGLPRVGVAEYEGRLEFIDSTPYSVLSPSAPSILRVGGGEIEWVVLPGELPYPIDTVERWIERAARAVVGYFGRLPVPRVALLVTPAGEAPAPAWGGSTMGYVGASIRVRAGKTLPLEADDDWILTHELVHLALPNLPLEHRWMEEGLATYVEPIVRRRAGMMSAEDAWANLWRGMPQGLPAAEDEGLDRIGALGRRQAWGRTYWGGALFWMMADVELLEKTEGRVGLDDVLRGILREGDIRTRWELPHLLDAAERASGVPVLRDLHERLAAAPGRPDLDDLWNRLGVSERDGRMVLDDDAPRAWIRRRVMGEREAESTR